ncbi:hypothetical protein ACVMBZ_003681 [Bradyrhizobium liaoningense]
MRLVIEQHDLGLFGNAKARGGGPGPLVAPNVDRAFRDGEGLLAGLVEAERLYVEALHDVAAMRLAVIAREQVHPGVIHAGLVRSVDSAVLDGIDREEVAFLAVALIAPPAEHRERRCARLALRPRARSHTLEGRIVLIGHGEGAEPDADHDRADRRDDEVAGFDVMHRAANVDLGRRQLRFDGRVDDRPEHDGTAEDKRTVAPEGIGDALQAVRFDVLNDVQFVARQEAVIVRNETLIPLRLVEGVDVSRKLVARVCHFQITRT